MSFDRQALQQAFVLACSWLADIAQIKTEQLTIEKRNPITRHKNWRGAIRGEYSAATREWKFFCPIWHTGQAIRALVAAHRLTGEPRWREAARLGGQFIAGERVSELNHPHYGLIFAFEDAADQVNTSAILECVRGLFELSDLTGEPQYAQVALDAVAWVAREAYLDNGLFRDAFDVKRWAWVPAPWKNPTMGRPLLDDAVFLEAYRRTQSPRYRAILIETAERLLHDEKPAGNWIQYPPCDPVLGTLHPRQAYWWGCPMLAVFDETRDRRFFQCAVRAGEWYLEAMRRDGGMFRTTNLEFNTASFGHATSGICCAMILWQELLQRMGEARWALAIEKALQFCLDVQFTEVSDPNLKGAILEKVLPPRGSDRSPYHLRDLGTIFFVQAAAQLMGTRSP